MFEGKEKQHGLQTIIFVASGLKPYGATRSMVALVKSMERLGKYKFVVLVRKGSHSVQLFLQQNRISFIVIPFHQNVFRLSYATPKLIKAVDLLQARLSCMRSTIVNKFWAQVWSRRLGEATLVHSNNLVSDFGLELASRLMVPHVQHIREYLKEDYALGLCRSRSFYRRHREARTEFIALSRDLRDTYVERGLISPTKVRVIHNPLQQIPVRKVHISGQELTAQLKICMPGRVFVGKNQMEAILALGHIKRIRPDIEIELTIYGDADDDYLAELEKTAAFLGISDWIKHKGFTNNLLDEFIHFDLGLASSHREVFARTVIEMMAAGLPVIAPRSGGFPEQLEHGVTGLLYSPGQPTDLAEKILSLADTRELRSKMGIQAQQNAILRFDASTFAAKIGRLYAEVLSRSDGAENAE